MTAAIFDPQPLISPEQAEADRQAFLATAKIDRKTYRTRRIKERAREDFAVDPRGAIFRLREEGRSWQWIQSTLKITKEEAWRHCR